MSFFSSPYFSSKHFKSEFYGGSFFQNPYFNDTPIAHGLTGGTGDPSLVTVACNRTITGTFDADEAILLINGTPATIDTVSSVDKDLHVAITDTIVGDDVLTLTFLPLDKNNVGSLDDFPIVNNEIIVVQTPFQDMTVPALKAYALDLGIDLTGINGKNNIIAAIVAWHEA